MDDAGVETMKHQIARPGRSGAPRARHLLVALLAAASLAAGCKETKDGSSAAVSPAGVEQTAAIVTQASWAPDALEELVAPIALYPDLLVGPILAASVNPQEVMDGGNWLLQNQDLQGDALDAAAAKAGFGPAMRSLLQFPTVVDMMCQQFDWTKQLGSAFTSDQKGVLDAVQRMRASAVDVGNLKSTPQQTVETRTEGGVTVVELKPADPQVVYVPQYDPQVVYTTPPAAAAPATETTTSASSSDDGSSAVAGLLLFGAGIALGAAIADDDYYPNYYGGAVYMGPRPFYPPAYVYRPVYTAAYRPAYGYHPPAGYRYNHQTNVVINNNNYYNRFDNNSNLGAGSTRSPLDNDKMDRKGGRDAGRDAGRATAATRDVQRNAGQSNWRGQSSYAGAKDKAKAKGPVNAANPRDKGDAASRAGGGTAATRAAAPRTSSVDRGYGGSSRTGSTAAASSRAGAPESRAARETTKPSAADRPQASDRPAESRVADSSPAPRRDTALSGANNSGSGSFERASSARGHASAQSSRQGSGASGARSGGGRLR
jgi:hypothetical protein